MNFEKTSIHEVGVRRVNMRVLYRVPPDSTHHRPSAPLPCFAN